MSDDSTTAVLAGPAPSPARLPRAVIALGLVSLLTDLSSEMIVPLLPAFLAGLGASGTFIGLIDGVGDTTSALIKLWSGRWSDRARRRKPPVLIGYGLSSLSRPLMSVIAAPWQALLVRFSDRVGKGLRTSPRDALIADIADGAARGRAYGFHRAMDHAGALLGPLVAYALLRGAGLAVETIFALAALPAALAMIVLATLVREPAGRAAVGGGGAGASASTAATSAAQPSSSSPADARAPLGPVFTRYMMVVALFTLASASDFFLLLRARELGASAASVLLLWALLHAVKAGLSTSLGALSDRLPRRRLIGAGWIIYAVVYLGFAFASEAWQVWVLFGIYGLYAAACEGAEKALVADLAPPGDRGRAFGWFHFVVGMCALPASLGFGVIWDRLGHVHAFVVAAGLAALATAGLGLVAAPRR
jgi:MFS family permease